jgi:hypothetical protein
VERDRQSILEEISGLYTKGFRQAEEFRQRGQAFLNANTGRRRELEAQIAVADAAVKRVDAMTPIKTPKAAERPSPDPAPELPATTKIQSLLLSVWGDSFHLPASPDKPFEPIYENDQRDQERLLNDDLRGLRSQLEDNDKVKRVIDDGVPAELASLMDTEFTNGDYKVNLFREFKKGCTGYGKFGKWDGQNMTFKDGGYCWETKSSRVTEMKVICGPFSKLLKVSEPKTCLTKATFMTPEVCSEELMRALSPQPLEQLKLILSEINVTQ